MPEPDKNLTPGQEGDAVAVYLAEARTRAERELRYICVAPEGPAWSCEDVPRLLGAVEAVRKIHYPAEVYALSVMASDHNPVPRVWCGHTYEETENDRHQMTDDDSIICLDKHEATVCAECWEEGGEQLEWPCPTYEAITAELTGEDGTDV